MKLYQKLISEGALLVGLAGLYGCGKAYSNEESQRQAVIENPVHFAEVPHFFESGMAMTSGDFNGDGNRDFIIGARPEKGNARLYLFFGDGDGNFSQ